MQKEITKSLGTHHIMVEKYNSTSSTSVRETPTPTSHKNHKITYIVSHSYYDDNQFIMYIYCA